MARALVIAYTYYIHDGRVKRHAEALARRGDEVDVICLDKPDRLNGVNIVGLNTARYRGSSRSSYISNYIYFFARAAILAARMSVGKPYDVVIACTMPDAVVLCTLALRLMGTRVVLDVHDTMPELYRDKFGGRRGAFGARLLQIQERLSAACADRVLAVHDPHRTRLEHSGIKAEKIRVVMNAPDSRIFKFHPRREAEPGGTFTIACHGTVARRLGLDVAIKAMAILRDRIPALRLLVVGDGDYLPEARALSAALGLDQQVAFLRPVPIEQLPMLLQRASVGLIPNHESSATDLMLPVKLLEYSTMGMPCISSRLRTIEHYFGTQSLRYFEPGNENSLADAMADLYFDPLLRTRLVNGAREVVRGIEWSRQQPEFYGAIDSILDHRPGLAPNGSQCREGEPRERKDALHSEPRTSMWGDK
ncbi:MAG TPA: glycosyltransferase family 4 protein [Candidatus Binataceae bacterium]|nr:glycosyltransferase family 4 protein [Candidatus Binataceae bacterium]